MCVTERSFPLVHCDSMELICATFVATIKKCQILDHGMKCMRFVNVFTFFFLSYLLTLMGQQVLYSEVYQEFQPIYDIFHRWCQRLIRPQAPCTPSLHCPIGNSA